MNPGIMGWIGGRAGIARPLLLLSISLCLPVPPAARGAEAEAATNPASDALNRTTDAIERGSAIPGLLNRERPRISQIIGAPVLGQANAPIGTVAEVMLSREGVLAIIQTGQRLVAIPIGNLRSSGGNLVLPEMTGEALRARPDYQFADPVR